MKKISAAHTSPQDAAHAQHPVRKMLRTDRSGSNSSLAAAITRSASKQTYYTIRFLVDRGRVNDAYRAYAYFRWVDDRLDSQLSERSERIAFVERQKALLERLYRDPKGLLDKPFRWMLRIGSEWPDLSDEEGMLVDLVRSDREINSGLQAYLRNMMAVMDFDARRRGRLISQKELDDYSRWLAIAVTEAMHYFIGHDDASPAQHPAERDDTRYLAVTAAHIVHMLRDARDDIPAGYVNIPREFLCAASCACAAPSGQHPAGGEANGISPEDLRAASCGDSAPYRLWVRSRVELARSYFRVGESYLARVENPRCRLAGYAYAARFKRVLDDIERNDYRLPSGYPGHTHPRAALHMIWSMVEMALNARQVTDLTCLRESLAGRVSYSRERHGFQRRG